ncbi:hypothetical protein CDAR_319221 [Caerostris darwini]|uniref:Uncharacterized protein n=1 Tax=Caerostris darwini TaxID=1538125 RepID=A0AAV4TX42_9ARAC|nr:hypothetical protein CDAR_319221 [Caerostris darwini]
MFATLPSRGNTYLEVQRKESPESPVTHHGGHVNSSNVNKSLLSALGIQVAGNASNDSTNRLQSNESVQCTEGGRCFSNASRRSCSALLTWNAILSWQPTILDWGPRGGRRGGGSVLDRGRCDRETALEEKLNQCTCAQVGKKELI